MDFKLWKKPEAGKKSPLLEIICPRVHNQKFYDMEATIKKAVVRAKRKMDSDGAPAAAILFSEGENFRFTITQEEGMEYAEKVRRLLPSGYFIAVAFNLLEDHGELDVCNNGYLVSREKILHSPKRNLTAFEKDLLGITMLSIFGEKWEERTRGLEDRGEQFSGLEFGAGLRIEHRLCADVCACPMHFEPQTITLVSAAGNLASYYGHLIGKRMAVVTNDATEAEPLVFKREGTGWGKKVLDEFHVLTVFENL